jgi:Alpha-N-acetylglucosaminidase (NAGLU) tim-barrel domain
MRGLTTWLLGMRTAGQEAAWLKVLPRWGVSQQELQAHFGGPAFLAWQRMGNIHSYAGPLPMSWIQDQAGAAVASSPHCNPKPIMPLYDI